MRIGVQKYKILTEKKANLRICHFSDTHYWFGYKNKILTSILEKVKELHPDYICITGDLLDQAPVAESPFIKNYLSFLEQLALVAPVVVILGNHDQTVFRNKKEVYIENRTFIKQLKNISNLHLLQNERIELPSIKITGYTPEPGLFKEEENRKQEFIEGINQCFLNKKKEDTYNILLLHSPLLISSKEVSKDINIVENTDLILCGHTHGGILPIYGKGNKGLIGPYKKLFPMYARGMVEGNPKVIIHGAIIKLSNTAGIIRHFNPIFPISVNLITITCKNDEK
ncbi:MAG: metallophosphoesterase [Bacilli bacterium]|nr:metallophosphoesterase [Bacilli bacterium]